MDPVEAFLRKHLKVADIFRKTILAPGKATTAIRGKYKGKKLASKLETTVAQLEALKTKPKGELQLVSKSSKGTEITPEELKHEKGVDVAALYAGLDLGEGV